MEKHQYGFAIMNCRTGVIKKKVFWATGNTEDECRKAARVMAKQYAQEQSDAYYEKEQQKNNSNYKLCRESYEFQVVGCSLWQ